MMEKQRYLIPVVRVIDLHMDTSFCQSGTVSGGLDDTYDEPYNWED